MLCAEINASYQAAGAPSHVACRLACLEQVQLNGSTPLQAGSGPLDRYLRLKAMQRESYMHFFYEVCKPQTLNLLHSLK